MPLLCHFFLHEKTCETHKFNNQLVSRMRLERMTLWLKVKCSTNWANETNIIIKMAASGGFEPPECQSQSLMPYHLATRQSKVVEGHGFEPWNPKEQIYSLPRLTTSLSLQKWCRQRESNPQPTDYKSVALPVTLCRQKMVGDIGLEPMTPCL